MCKACIADIFGIEEFFGSRLSRATFIAASAAVAGVAAMGLPRRALAASPSPATVFFNGSIITMDESASKADAVAISGGTILAAGAKDDVMRAAGAGAARVDLDGRTLMPGLIDAHQHPVPGGLIDSLMLDVGVDTYKNKADVLSALRAKVKDLPSGQWLYAAYYDNVLQGGYLSMSELDSVSADHPIFVYYVSMHTATGNAAAFKLAGVTASTGALPGGGYFGKDAQGNLNGMIYEPLALVKFMIGLPKLSMDLVSSSMTKFLYNSAALGITMVHEAGAYAPHPNVFEAYRAMMAGSPTRYSTSPAAEFLDAANQFVAPYGKPGAKAIEVPNSLLSFYAVKIVADGSPQQETAYQSEPYLNSKERGNPNYSASDLNALVLEVKRSGWPISIHCNGDGSLDMALDAIEAAYGSSPPAAINRIEHCPQARPEQIARMKKLGVEPSHLMNNVYYYGAAYRTQIFGPDRADRFNPTADWVAAGIPFSIHSDCPCSPVSPLREIGTAVTRICAADGSVIGENQRVSIELALQGMTSVAARHCGLGDKLGTLTAGKYADLAILESNPLKTDPAKLGDIKVSETWVAGKKVQIPAG